MAPYLTRRQWLLASALLTVSARVKGNGTKPYQYMLAEKIAEENTPSADFYVPFGWGASRVPSAGPGLTLVWKPASSAISQPARLRISSATDVREVCTVLVKTATSGQEVGVIDVRYATYMQPFELAIPNALLPTVIQEGVILTQQSGNKPFWIFSRTASPTSAPDALLPHILLSDQGSSADAWKERLLSVASVQTFGWMHGCVLDGLQELSQSTPEAKELLKQHLALYFGNDRLEYAGFSNSRLVNTINGVESLLPFAMLAQVNPRHPGIDRALAFCKDHVDANGVIADGEGTNRTIKTEECYTVSYPLAVMAKQLKRPELVSWAIQTLMARTRTLHQSDAIYQRGSESGGNLTFGNWGRGVAWYLLGLAKSLVHLPNNSETETLRQTFRRAVDQVLGYQQPNGLWFCFMDQPQTGLETSGSAGIAAALSYGYRHGLLDRSARVAAAKAGKGLVPYFTPDGFLTGTVQANKGGLALQTGNFRVIAPYTLGFLAHVYG
ncbi:hypothetical protein DYU11_02385 [Fibrisoma montanum]|uniref:Glycosyl hydrolase n=1 Tax=Fibrisoma montanum TaxID=2305895 RepID=A0A418MIC6_9BACT|nr:glycoside hydrolase family 88 protein [Fibrisoma montanum]RIV27180.1 hypothetical protein DYU11_02385 [Fibrisoma montanum]